MVNNNQVRCHACGRVLVIRVTVAGGLQEFVFPCPYCAAQLMGTFYAMQPTERVGAENSLKRFEIKSEDFDVLAYDKSLESPELLAVAVNTELPVHVSMLSEAFTERTFSPFIRLVQLSGHSDSALEVIENVNVLRRLRFELLPPVRRAAVFYGQGDMEKLERELRNVPGLSEMALNGTDPWNAIGAILQGFLRTLGVAEIREAANDELRNLLEASFERDRDATRKLLADFNARALKEHRRALIDTLIRALAVNDALVAGLWLEALPDLDLADYRIQRSDYDDIKTLYQEIFELGSRTLVLPASVANIVHRGDPREYCDGERLPLREALTERAETREGWLEELPAAKALYSDTARRTRNLIGHRLVSYDYEQAVVIDNRGNPHNYLLFLRDYLGAVRSCCYLLDVVEFLTDVEQLE